MPINVCALAHCNVNCIARTKRRRIAERGLGTAAGNDSVPHRKVPSHYSIVTSITPFIFALPLATQAAALSQTEFTALAARCAPAVPVATLEAVARTESGLDPWALHDNTTSRKEDADSLELAATDASQWVGRGDSVDIGLMQINAANLHALGMTVTDALDPCESLAGGAAVLRAAYGGGVTPAAQQAALLMALSRYNTGTPFQGIMNGYVHTVLENAGKGDEALPIPLSPVQPSLLAKPNAPPSWNISAVGIYAQQHGASWVIEFAPAPTIAGASPDTQLITAAREQLPAEGTTNLSTPPTTR